MADRLSSRFLIINCPSEYFLHIPMGTFGLCDYLNKKGINTKILNLALYDRNEAGGKLDHYIRLFNPSHAGLIFHWQETAEGFLQAGELIKSRFPHIKILCGGFTAGYFGENLLKRCTFPDFVVKGDPEKPLELLLGGKSLQEIPNLVYRDEKGIRANEVSYFIDEDTLSGMSFCDVTLLFDHELYIKAVEDKFGFPIFIGRGCVFQCSYCGGSCNSYRLHSERAKPVTRSIRSVITDLKRLKGITRKIYICYENDKRYLKALFEEIKKEEGLVKAFVLNYGAWHTIDREFLDLYRDVFIVDKENKPLFEISPEVFDDKSRKKVKGRKNVYTLNDLKENLSLINDRLQNNVNVSVFFSRYHDTALTYRDIRKEISGIFLLKHELLDHRITNVTIACDHLSTDVASRYWETYVKNNRDLDTLISASRKIKSQELYCFPFNNLCIYIPETLSEEDILRCELLIYILKVLEKHYFEYFHILFECLRERFIKVIESVINQEYAGRLGNVFRNMDYSELLNSITLTIVKSKSHFSEIPFIEDLTGFSVKKAMFGKRRRDIRSSYRTEHPRLNLAFISCHEHDYLNLPDFLKGLENKERLRPEKTVFIFLKDEILSMTNETYCLTLKRFEKGISVDEYYKMMEKQHIFTPSYHRNLVEKLFQSDVLY